MTKNHILTKGVALGVLLMLSSYANATDQVLVQYFQKLYKTTPPACTVDDAKKTLWLQEIEPKCLNRITVSDGQYIGSLKPGCTEAGVKAALDAQLAVVCTNAAAQNDKAAIAKQQQLQQQAQAKQASQSPGGGSGSSSKDSRKEAKELYSSLNKISGGKIEKEVKAYTNKAEDYVKDKAQSVWGSDSKKDSTSTGAKYVPVTDEDRKALAAQNAAQTTPNVSDTVTKYQGPDGTQVVVTKNPTMTTIEQIDPQTGEILKSDMVNGASQPQIDEKVFGMGGRDKIPDGGAPSTAALANQTDAALAGAKDAATQTVAGAAAPAQAVAGSSPQASTDAATTAAKPKVDAEDAKDQTFPAQAKTALATAKGCEGPPAAHAAKIGTAVTIRSAVKKICNGSSATAGFLCPLTTSPDALKVQTLMSAGAAVLSKATAASESCNVTSNISKIGQAGMLVGQLSCTTAKYSCDGACGKTQSQGQKLIVELEALHKELLAAAEVAESEALIAVATENVPEEVRQDAIALACKTSATQVTTALTTLKAETEPVAQKIIACQKHSADIALMGISALGLMSAFQDAEKCKEQLASGSNGTGTSTSSLAGPQMTTAEYCAQPQNAATITCKCTANPSAEGCMGSLAGSGVALGKVNSDGGASGFASAKTNGLGSVNSLAKTSTEKGEAASGTLSAAAREALGIGSAGMAAGGSSGGSGGSFGSDSEASKGSKAEREKSKFGFFSSIGNMLSGGKSPSTAAKAAIRGYEQDQAIKRKLASDQVRAEITAASGKTNFDKIKSRYQSNVSSFEQ